MRRHRSQPWDRYIIGAPWRGANPLSREEKFSCGKVYPVNTSAISSSSSSSLYSGMPTQICSTLPRRRASRSVPDNARLFFTPFHAQEDQFNRCVYLLWLPCCTCTSRGTICRNRQACPTAISGRLGGRGSRGRYAVHGLVPPAQCYYPAGCGSPRSSPVFQEKDFGVSDEEQIGAGCVVLGAEL